jgi:hypothetical protein
MQRGQAAMEFMSTYGWMLLVVIGAILALAYNGVLTADKALVDTCIATTPFFCTEAKVTDVASGNVQVNIKNKALSDMASVTVSLTCDDGSAATNATGTGAQLLNDESQLVIFTCPQVPLGVRWRGNYTITYVKTGDDISHDAPGSMTLHVES